MLDIRNGTSHLYDQHLAEEIYKHIMMKYGELAQTYAFLWDRFSDVLY